MAVPSSVKEGCDRGALPTSAEISLERMANEAEKITGFVGGAIYDKLRAYCARLSAELEDELKRTVPIVVNDPVDAEVRLKAYLTHKLK